MFCCANCFDDNHLRLEIFPARFEREGPCSYCESENQKLMLPISLREHFELVTGIYIKGEEGKTLVEWLKEDWSMFAHERMDNARSQMLLAEIFNDGDRVRQRFVPSNHGVSDTLVRWDCLREELMHSNRYFPKTGFNLDRLKRLFDFLLLRGSEVSQGWFRARIQLGASEFSAGEMMAPPKHLASHGRANPAGIPYLYLASNELTAISETRPHTGDVVYVASINLPSELKIADLRHPRKTVSPFILPDEDEISLLRGDIEFLERLGDELTRPILPRSAAFDYIPSQYLCEFIKDCGFDGVMYRSSVGDGNNLAIFNPLIAEIGVILHRQVSRVTVSVG